MDMTLIVSFPGTEQTTLAEVGGKGYSLIRMVEAGLPVPPGAVPAVAALGVPSLWVPRPPQDEWLQSRGGTATNCRPVGLVGSVLGIWTDPCPGSTHVKNEVVMTMPRRDARTDSHD